MINRVIIIVLDSVGVGELPDASLYGDVGTNTLAHVAQAVGGLDLPNFERLGLGNIIQIEGVPPVEHAAGAFGKMTELSCAKDSTTGHWELAGIITKSPWPIYPDGFPPEVIEPFERAIGRGILGNRTASGTDIMKELGEEHVRTGKPIVYTSADSVFQIAAHEDIVPLSELYRWCEIAREIMAGPHAVARVIARPFLGKPGEFYRTPARKDFSVAPPVLTVLDRVHNAGLSTIAIGKIEDLFACRAMTEALHGASNKENTEHIISVIVSGRGSLVFANLVDFDMKYGHRNDPEGYAAALKAFDSELPTILSSMKADDLLIITADHGCDPTTPGTDHTREYVPVIAVGPATVPGVDMGVRASFCDVAGTVCEALGVASPPCAKSFLGDIL